MAYNGLKLHPHFVCVCVRACVRVCVRAHACAAKSDNIVQTHMHAWNFIGGA